MPIIADREAVLPARSVRSFGDPASIFGVLICLP
jgi:hypothetical protein